jgi:prepilin-type N-terminal cleavage/methylation domain-containing protein
MRGFTLFELVVVVVVTSILAAIVLFTYNVIVENSREKAARQSAAQFARGTLAVAKAESTAVAELSPDAHTRVDDDATKANIGVLWERGPQPGDEGDVAVEVRKYTYCTPVLFQGGSLSKYVLGETVRAARCPWAGQPGGPGGQTPAATTTPTSPAPTDPTSGTPTTGTPTTPPSGTPSPDAPSPTTPPPGTTDPPIIPTTGAMLTPGDYKPIAPITAMICPNDSGQLVNQLNTTGQTTVDLTFDWSDVPGATSYDVHLTPLAGETSKISVAENVPTSKHTFRLPRAAVDQWGTPKPGQDQPYYSKYAIRILPHVGPLSGEPYYRVFQYLHYSIFCFEPNASNNDEHRVAPINQIIRETVWAELTKLTDTAEVTLSWAPVPNATAYRVSMFSDTTGNKYGINYTTSAPSAAIKFPRQAVDQWGNPQGPTPDFYDTYWVRIQPIGADWDGDPRYRKMRYYHWENTIVHSPDGYW